MRAPRLILLTFSLALATGCGDDGSGDSSATTGAQSDCDMIGEACHEASTPDAMACHDVGHDGDEAMCTAMKAACLDACAGGGATSSGSTGGDATSSSSGSTGGGGSTGTGGSGSTGG